MKERRIEEIIDFGDLPVFPEATTYPCILRISRGATKSIFNATVVKTLAFKRLVAYVTEHRYAVDRSKLEDSGWSLVNESIQLLLEKLLQSGITLNEYVDGKIYRGIITGLNDAFVIDRNTRNMLIAKDPKNSELIKPFLVGRDIKRFEPPESDQYLILIPDGWTKTHLSGTINAWIWFQNNYPSLADHLSGFSEDGQKRYDKGEYWWELRSCDYYNEFEKPKIILPDISPKGNFALDADGKYYSANTTYIIISGDRYLLTLLNSALLTFYYKNLLSTYRGGYLRFFTQYLVQLPIRCVSFTTAAPERARLGAELQELYGAGKFDEILAIVESCLPKDAQGNFIAEQERSDVVHDLLAFLAERMLEMNKEKQQETKGFLGWLEGEVGARIEDLSPKTKIQGYYDYDYDDFYTVLKKNRKRLAINPSSRERAELLKDEFEKSMAKLGPLREKIERMDRLIDAVVYRLYGLNEEEIRIVEGNAS